MNFRPPHEIYILARKCDFATSNIYEQRRLRRACANAQTRQSHRCTHTHPYTHTPTHSLVHCVKRGPKL